MIKASNENLINAEVPSRLLGSAARGLLKGIKMMLSENIAKVKGLFNEVSFEISVEVIPSSEIRLEVELSLVAQITEAEYVWSSFYNEAFPVGKLQFLHCDSDGVAGYKVMGSNTVLWRDQLTYVEYVA